MNKVNNSCGSSGCDVKEHIKRTGFDRGAFEKPTTNEDKTNKIKTKENTVGYTV